MAFQKVSGTYNYVKYSECLPGQILAEGHFIGTRTDQFEKSNYLIKSLEGETTCLNSAGHLAYLMENNVTKGDYIRVTYAGKEVQTKGKFEGKESHRFELEIDTDRSQGAAGSASADGADDDDTDDDDDEVEPRSYKRTTRPDVDDDEVDEDEEQDRPVTAKPAVAKQVPNQSVSSEKSAVKKKSAQEVLDQYRKRGA